MHWSVSKKEAVVLALLERERELYGLQLVELSGGALKRGTVYVTLGRMEEKGLVSSRREDASPASGGLPRRLYKVSALGKAVIAAQHQVARRVRRMPA
jgi:DNA-binding PadR family transcriptional regulator